MTGIVCYDSTFLNLVTNDENFIKAYEKAYGEKFVSTEFLDIVKDMMEDDFMTSMSTQSD